MKAITVARKPLEGTVASNVLTHGCGGINVDGTRIKQGEQPSPTTAPGWDSFNKANAEQGYRPSDYRQGDAEYQLGRWPANLILNHLDGCRCEGVKKVKGQSNTTPPLRRSSVLEDAGGHFSVGNLQKTPIKRFVDEDGNETIADWICVDGCPVKALDEQSGVSESASAGVSFKDTPARSWKNASKEGIRRVEHGDKGGASRFFKQVKP